MQPAKKSSPDQALRPFVDVLQVGDPIGHANLTLVPLRSGRHERIEYLLAAEAIQNGTLEITEVSESGSVPELLANNESGGMVLLLDGEELVGAKQNRILNTSVLLPAKSKTKIPVSCVEQGRWRHISDDFRSGSYSPAGLRARKSRDVSRSLLSMGQAMSNQGAVWDDVAERAAALQTASPTMAMHDVVEQSLESLNVYVEALGCPAEACGVAVAVCGRFIALDLLNRPDVFNRLWTKLVSGYAMDAIDSEETAKPAGSFDAHDADRLLARLGEIQCEAFASVGVGEDWRFETPDFLGHALVAEGACVHLSAFPGTEVGQG